MLKMINPRDKATNWDSRETQSESIELSFDKNCCFCLVSGCPLDLLS